TGRSFSHAREPPPRTPVPAQSPIRTAPADDTAGRTPRLVAVLRPRAGAQPGAGTSAGRGTAAPASRRDGRPGHRREGGGMRVKDWPTPPPPPRCAECHTLPAIMTISVSGLPG